MADRSYSESEAWTILFGGFIVGIVLTSVFWAYATAPDEPETINESSLAGSNITILEPPHEFQEFCRKIKGKSEWDNTGFKKCGLAEYDDRNLMLMSVLCKKYGLNLMYGSSGVKCEGISR